MTVDYMPGSQHRVIMYADDVNINNEMISNKLAMQRMSGN